MAEAVAGWVAGLTLPEGDARVTLALELARQVDADPGSSGMWSRLQVAVDRVAGLAAEHRQPGVEELVREFMTLPTVEDCEGRGGHHWVVAAGEAMCDRCATRRAAGAS